MAKSSQDGLGLKPYLKCVVLDKFFQPVHDKEMPIFVIMSCITLVLSSVLIYHLAGSFRIIQVTREKLSFHTDAYRKKAKTRPKERFSTKGNYTAFAETEIKRIYKFTPTLA